MNTSKGMQLDDKIIPSFKRGDARAFDIIYHHYSKKLFHFAYGLVKDKEVAKDLVQEVFINLWEKRDQVDINLTFDNYIFTIGYNSIRKFFRKRAIENRAIENLLKETPGVIEKADALVIYNELFNMAMNAIEKLPPRRQAVYKLSRQEGMKIKEIAQKLNISTRTAENHLAHALKYLKEELSGNSLFTLLFFYLFLQ